MNTIFAPITGIGGAVTVFRLSGAQAFAITARLTQPPRPRYAALRRLRHDGEILDTALVTIFPAPNSYTGEDCVEFSLHGGRAVRLAFAAALLALGARPAEPGEFSRRAFLNARLDLLQAEGIADLIAAETEAQRRQAIAGAGWHAAIAEWREALRHIIARQEALIDFPDEDLPPDVEAGLLSAIRDLHAAMTTALAASPAAERLREGLEFVIIGPPNAGKSTLLNALAGAEIAIVAETPGTTRDAVSARLDLAGIPVHVTDTAGLRETEDAIEAEGILRARRHAARADLVLSLAGPGQDFAPAPDNVEVLRLATKSDLGGAGLSALTGAGMQELLNRLAGIAQRLTQGSGIAFPRLRQSACIRDAAAGLTRALENPEAELRGEDLREAAAALARLTGAIGVEEILDAVFSGFCIGK